MTHFHNRTQFLTWVRDNAPNPVVRKALDRGTVTVWGLFKGGFVVEVESDIRKYVIGVRASEKHLGEYFTGLLSRVPFNSYVGGNTPLTAGDYPEKAIENRSKEHVPRPILKKRLPQ